MTESCTNLDLIRLIYHETDAAEELRLRKMIAEDQSLAASYAWLLESVRQLDGVSLDPSETSVNLVLNYSRQQVEETSQI